MEESSGAVRVMETPMSDKVLALGESWDVVAEFLDWLLGERRLVLCTYEGRVSMLIYAGVGKEALRAEFFEIDLDQLEIERRAILMEAQDLFKEDNS